MIQLLWAYVRHWIATLTFSHNGHGIPRTATPAYWALFAVFYTVSFMRWSEDGLIRGMIEPLLDWMIMQVIFSTDACFLWLFVSITVDLIVVINRAVPGSFFDFDPAVEYRWALKAIETFYCFYYTIRLRKAANKDTP